MRTNDTDLALRIPRALLEALQAKATAGLTTVSTIVRQALAQYVEYTPKIETLDTRAKETIKARASTRAQSRRAK